MSRGADCEIQRRAPYRVGTETCTSTKRYVYDAASFRIVSGARYFDQNTGDVVFSDPLGDIDNDSSMLARDGTYRTVFGPAVAHNGKILANSVANLQGGVRRMLNVRDPNLPDLGRGLRAIQIQHIGTITSLIDRLCTLYTPHFTDYCGAFQEALEHHADPHQKKQLRIDAWSELIQSGRVLGNDWFRHDNERINYKLKKNEIAKPNKWIRAIGDLGVAASLFGFRLTKFLKFAMACEPIDETYGTLEFIPKPNPAVLDKLFRDHITASKPIFSYFSDDSILSFYSAGTWYSFNVDISSCDASHGPMVFDALERITPTRGREDMRILINQCRRAFKIVNPSAGRSKEKITFQCNVPRLFSGWTGTTAMNNLACIIFGHHIITHLDTFDGTEQWIIDKAAETGYTITVERNYTIYDMQFLKHSPVYDRKREIRALLNFGVFLRSSGTCKGDLPGRGDLVQRGCLFQAALLRGTYPRLVNPLIHAFKCCAGSRVDKKTYYKIVREELAYKLDYSELMTEDELDSITRVGDELDVDNDEFLARYRLTAGEVLELEEFATLGYGWHIASSSVDKIINKDYGINTYII